jgi:hypothetical protein
MSPPRLWTVSAVVPERTTHIIPSGTPAPAQSSLHLDLHRLAARVAELEKLRERDRTAINSLRRRITRGQVAR